VKRPPHSMLALGFEAAILDLQINFVVTSQKSRVMPRSSEGELQWNDSKRQKHGLDLTLYAYYES